MHVLRTAIVDSGDQIGEISAPTAWDFRLIGAGRGYLDESQLRRDLQAWARCGLTRY
jgi:hypothetical protein